MIVRLLTFLASFFLFASGVFAQTATIAVAANMKDAFAEIVSVFRSSDKSEMRVVYGSSGNFTAQIISGAPFSLLIAADERFPLELYKKGLTVDQGAVYAIGKLAIITKSSSSIQLLDNKVDITKAFMQANKVAIAKPDLAPYGSAAVQYLKAQGLWNTVKDKLVYADNVGAATTYVMSGAADIGFTAFSLAKSPRLSQQASFLLVDSKLYEPIQQRMVLIKGAPQEAIDMYRFMQGPQAKAILQKYGYSTP